MKFEAEYGIGMRNVKTALSVFLCILISNILKLEYPFYVVIAAIISMENSISNSLRVGKNRMMGTLIGASVGLVFALIQPDNALLCGVGVVAIIYLCNLLKWNSAISIAGVVFSAIMLNLNGKSPVSYSFNRIIDTFIGINVSLLVNYLIFPYNHKKVISHDMNNLSKKISSDINQRICLELKVNLNDLEKEIQNIRKGLTLYNNEMKFKKDKNSKMNNIELQFELYKDIYEHLKMIDELQDVYGLNSHNKDKLKELNYGCLKNIEYSGDDMCIVYNYHAGKILEYMERAQLIKNDI